MSKVWKCANCGGLLERLIDGEEWITPDGAIFCSITDEIHAREIVNV